jgi:hypothetical protein
LEGTTLNYNVVNDPGVSYAWIFPSDWLQTAGGTTNEVTVTVGSGSGDITVTPSTPCGTGAPRTLAVVTVPANLTVSNIIIPVGQSNCYNATGTIVVAGGENTFVVQAGGSVTMIAGQNIIYLPGTTADSGAYMLGYITLDGNYCTTPSNPLVSNLLKDGVTLSSGKDVIDAENIRIYPNPTTGIFTLEQTVFVSSQALKLEIYTLLGKRIMSDNIMGEKKHQINLGDVPAGIYLVRIMTGEKIETIKLVKQ